MQLAQPATALYFVIHLRHVSVYRSLLLIFHLYCFKLIQGFYRYKHLATFTMLSLLV